MRILIAEDDRAAPMDLIASHAGRQIPAARHRRDDRRDEAMTRPATTLLIVDDDPDVRRTIARWLGSNEFTVTEAGTAGEALDQMAEHAAAITVCDVGLPDRNGLWLAAQMRRQFPHTALVITTGFGIAALPSNLDADAIGYLPKPFTKQQLLRTLEWAIEWRREHEC